MPTPLPAPIMPHSDYLVFVDESGDHGLKTCDPSYPMFVLAFCIISKQDYSAKITPAMMNFKFKHFGHDWTILHEHEIRKAKGEFAFLTDATKRTAFLDDLSGLMRDAPMALVAVVIHKQRLAEQYNRPPNPYHLAMEYGLERIVYHLQSLGQSDKRTPVVFERRGKNEDDELELEFLRLAARFPELQIHFADKKANLAGLQLADLVARPIGRHVMNPAQPNQAYDIIQAKFRRKPSGDANGWGLKIVP